MWSCRGVLFLALAGCSVEIEVPREEPPVPRFSFSTDLVTGIVKQPTTVVVKLTYVDGTPASDYEFIPVTSCEPTGLCAVTTETIGPGEEQITITSVQDGYFKLEPYVRVFNVDGVGTRNFTAPGIWMAFASDEPEFLSMLNRGVTIVPGEKRAVTMGTANRYHMSGMPLTYEIADPSIATVDADGVVTGVSTGTTALKIIAVPEYSYRDIEVHVVAGVVGPPADNVIHRMDEDGRYTSQPQPRHWRPASPRPNHTLVVDSRGYPHLVFKVDEQVGIASWSGTGFGFELLPERFEGATVAVLGIDETDHLYAVAATRIGTYVLYDKPATAPPSAWVRRHLDVHWNVADRFGMSITDYNGGTLDDPDIAIIPRPGGGVYVGYPLAINRQDFLGYGCAEMLRLADITASTITTHHVHETWRPWSSKCAVPTPKSALLHLVPTAGLPLVIDRDVQHSYDGTRWTAATFSSALDFGTSATGQEITYPLVAQPAPGMPTPFVAQITAAGLGAEAVMMVQARDHVYLVTEDLNVFERYVDGELVGDGYANAFIDDPLAQPFIQERMRAFGLVSTGDRVHAVTSYSVSGTSTPEQVTYLQRKVPAPDTKTTDPVTSGTRIQDSLFTTLLQAAPVFLADGTRVFLTRGYAGSATTAFLVAAPASSTWVSRETTAGARRVWAVGNELFAFSASQALMKSTDQAQTFSVLAPAAGLIWYAEGVFASGVAAHVYNTTLGPRIRIAANVIGQTSVTFTEVNLTGVSNFAHESAHQLMEAPTGVYHLMVIDNGVPADTLLLRQYSGAGAELLERAFAPSIGANDTVLAKTAVVTAAGMIAVLSRTTNGAVSVHLLNPATGAVQSTALGNYGGTPAPLVRLPDSRIALVGSQSTKTLFGASGRSQEWHVTLRTSSDGLTFSSPTELRADGGDLQYVFGVTPTPTGDLLMGLMDNALMSGEVTGALFAPPYETNPTLPILPAANIFQAEVP